MLNALLTDDSLVFAVIDFIKDTMIDSERSSCGGLVAAQTGVIDSPLCDSTEDSIVKDNHLGIIQSVFLFLLCQSKTTVVIMDI